MTTPTREVGFCQLLDNFPVHHFAGLKDQDLEVISESIKIFKDPSYKSSNFNFLEGRDIYLISHFFATYGEQIAQTNFYECDKIEGKYCCCFIENCSEKDVSLLSNVLKILKSNNSASNLSLNLLLERDLKNVSLFLLKHSEKLKIELNHVQNVKP